MEKNYIYPGTIWRFNQMDEQRARHRMMSSVYGIEIKTENQYLLAAAGAPKEVIQADNISAHAYQLLCKKI